MSHSCYCPTMTAYFNFFSWCMINVSGGGMWETKLFNPPRFHLVLLCPLSRDKNSLWDWWIIARGMAKFEATPHLQLLCGWYLNMDSWSSERNSNSVQFWDVICLQVDINIGNLIVLRLCIDWGVTMQTPNTKLTPWHVLIDFNGLHEALLSIPSYEVLARLFKYLADLDMVNGKMLLLPSYSVQLSCSVMFYSLRPHGLQHARLPYHQLPELAQTHVHQVGDAVQPSHPMSSPFPPAFNLSQHQGLFQWVNSLL